MALTENAQNYVDELTPLVKKYAEIYGYSPNVVPAIVAQSCYETGYGDMSNDIPRVAHNYFGIKHGGLNYYTGMTYDTFTGKLIPSENLIITPENRSHLWRAYDTMEDGVRGYFEFLEQHNAYSKLKTISNPEEYLLSISRAGYAGGGSDYGNKSISIMKTNDLINYCNSISASGIPEDFTLNKQDTTTSQNEVISSDLELVVSLLNNIKNSNNKSTYEKTTTTYESTTNIPNNLTNGQNSYLEISNNLTESLNKELSVIASVAQCYYDMDNDLANEQKYQTQIDNFLSTDITFDINFTNYMFEPNSLIQGSSGKVKRTEIADLLNGDQLNGPIHNNLSIAKESARNTMESIADLQNTIATSDKLKGEAWQQISQKLDEYNEILKLKISLADTLESAMANALKLILAYLEDYDYIDDTKLEETVKTILEAKATISTLKMSISQTQTSSKEVTDESGNTKIETYTEYVYSANARKAMQSKITELEQIIEELTKEVRKQEGLYNVLAQAEQIINDALSEVYSKYATKVSNIVTGTEVSYTSPNNTTYVSPETIPSRLEQDSQTYEIPSGKVTKEDFDKDSELKNTYGTYEDYLNGVEIIHNNEYTDTANKGIGLSEELSDLISKNPKENLLEESTKAETTSKGSYNSSPNINNPYNDSSNNTSTDNKTEEKPETSEEPSDSPNTSSDNTNSNTSSNENTSNKFYESEEISSGNNASNTASKENNQETIKEPDTDSTIDDKLNNNDIKDSATNITSPSKNNSKTDTSSKDNYYYDDKQDIFSNNSTSIFKTVGIAAATVGAVGATAYGAKKYLEKRNNDKDKSYSSNNVNDTNEEDKDDTGLDGFE